MKLTFDYTLITIEKTENPCKRCALSVRNIFCMGRKICKYTDDNPKVYYFNGLSE